MAAPTATNDTGLISLRELIDFISHVADCYPDITKDFPQQLIDMLSQHHLVLEPELREKIVGSLVLLRKKDLLDSATYVQLFYGLRYRAIIDFLSTSGSFIQCSPYSSPRQVKRCEHFSSKRSLRTFAHRTPRQRTISSTRPCRPSFSTWSHQTVHLPRVCGPSSSHVSCGNVRYGRTPRLLRS